MPTAEIREQPLTLHSPVTNTRTRLPQLTDSSNARYICSEPFALQPWKKTCFSRPPLGFCWTAIVTS